MAKKNRIAWQDLRSFMWRYAQGQYGAERLGQAFLNEHFVDVQDPDLFYCEDNHVAYMRISGQYVDWNSSEPEEARPG